MIKAKETSYKGYRFRSRLEARWAVFFDHLGLKWEYEPQGFVLPSGSYLPDFHIGEYAPGMHTYGPWVEIKGVMPSKREVTLMEELCEEGASYGLIIVGSPGEENFLHFHKEGFVDDDSVAGIGCYPHWSNYLFDCSDVSAARVKYALAAARGARFEFGESGARRGF
jgi:hypothetical protein